MKSALHVLMAQINPTVGAVTANCNHILNIIENEQKNYDLIVFPEMALTGYPPEDLLFRKEFQETVNKGLLEIQQAASSCHVIVGHPAFSNNQRYNGASVFYQKNKVCEYYKQNLPNYSVFDESRYFTSGPQKPCVLEIKHYKIGLVICEDLWLPGPVEALIDQGISALVSINASPFDYKKQPRREKLLKHYAQQGITVFYINQVCGQDELLFDGQSFALDTTGTLCARAPAFEEALCPVLLDKKSLRGNISPLLAQDALIYKALVYGTADYVRKNQFPGLLLGLSGGVDSALTLAIAVDAVGAEQVHAVLMPSIYTAAMSNEDALKQIALLGVSHCVLPINPLYQTACDTLKSEFKSLKIDTAEENIQARLRGLLLMALSNKTGKMLLATSNKSETAVGYATLYGDMAGGLSVLKDVLKTQVYRLAAYRNSLTEVIPQRVLTRAPSAELKANQTDQDSLPDYAILDAILTAYMEEQLSVEDLVCKGFSSEDVNKVLGLLQKNEYKRRQSAPGLKISPVAFDKDWRYPLTNHFKVF